MSELPADQQALVESLAEALRSRGLRLVTAESCTGGLIAAACTSQAGSSEWFERGFVTYSNEAKTELLGVPAALIEQHGAVSEAVARAMAEGALLRSRAQVAVSVTGIAGPGGATPGKPVGTVWLAIGHAGVLARSAAPVTTAVLLHGAGDRAAVRRQTVLQALQALLDSLDRT
jgi:nicotinamide-nucleotide amidase